MTRELRRISHARAARCIRQLAFPPGIVNCPTPAEVLVNPAGVVEREITGVSCSEVVVYRSGGKLRDQLVLKKPAFMRVKRPNAMRTTKGLAATSM